MVLRFNQLLTDAGIEPTAIRLLRHQTTLRDGRTPLELWRADPTMLETYQSYQSTAHRSRFKAPWWATFVGTDDGRTLFVGVYEVGDPAPVEMAITPPPAAWLTVTPGIDDYYPSRRATPLSEYIGRLYVDWGSGSWGKRSWRQRADLRDKPVTELHLDAAEHPFPGLQQLAEPLSVIMAAPPLWIAQLQSARGVYLLTCPNTGELYVGSATGADGFWGRWLDYAANGHGGNVALRSRERTDWVVSVLQVAGSVDTSDDILGWETLWKRKHRGALNRN